MKSRAISWILTVVGALVILVAAQAAYGVLTTPAAIRNPKSDHAHLRLQLIVDGKPVNFADTKFQNDLPGVCSAKITDEPIHFHDHIDQFVHLHWRDMTGGILLKDYGWNFIGGLKGALGYRTDGGLKLVPIHGNDLPLPPMAAHFYVYAGDEHGYQQKNWDDFLHQTLEQFLGHPSNATVSGGFWNWLVPAALAHSEVIDSSGLSQEQLTEINNLLGNVVIFVQKEPPAPAQIQDRFNQLEPLSNSACGG